MTLVAVVVGDDVSTMSPSTPPPPLFAPRWRRDVGDTGLVEEPGDEAAPLLRIFDFFWGGK